MSIFHLISLLMWNHPDIYWFGVPDAIITINYQPITNIELKVLKLQSGMALTLTLTMTLNQRFIYKDVLTEKPRSSSVSKPTEITGFNNGFV